MQWFASPCRTYSLVLHTTTCGFHYASFWCSPNGWPIQRISKNTAFNRTHWCKIDDRRWIGTINLFFWFKVHHLEHFYMPAAQGEAGSGLEEEQTVWCSRIVWFLVIFGRFEVRFWAKIRCSDMFKVQFSRFGRIINKVCKQFGI